MPHTQSDSSLPCWSVRSRAPEFLEFREVCASMVPRHDWVDILGCTLELEFQSVALFGVGAVGFYPVDLYPVVAPLTLPLFRFCFVAFFVCVICSSLGSISFIPNSFIHTLFIHTLFIHS